MKYATHDRQDWIDILKAIGIGAVVIGHIVPGAPAKIVYLFHMPLFFLLSGYLFKTAAPAEVFAKGARRLLVPYACFLVLLFMPTLILFDGHITTTGAARLAAKFVYGGSVLIGYEAVFWFVTCLFLTQLVASLLVRLPKGAAITTVVAMAIAAYANACFAPAYRFPWAANIVLVEVPLFMLGRWTRSVQWTAPRICACFVVVALSVVAVVRGAAIGWDMKFVVYGVPVLSVVIAWSWFVLLAAVSRRLAGLRFVSAAFGPIGRMSFAIMFLHMPVQIFLRGMLGISDSWARAVAALALSLVVALLLDRFEVTRMLFLGTPSRPKTSTQAFPGVAEPAPRVQ